MAYKVIKNTSAYMLAGLFGNLINLLLLPVYTRFMSPADFGVLAMVTAFSSLLIPFMGLQLTTSVSRFYFECTEETVKDLFSTVLYSILAANALIFLVLHAVHPWILRIAFANVEVSYLPFVALAIAIAFVDSLVNLCNILLQVRQEGKRILTVAVFRAISNAALGLYFVVLLRKGAEGALLAKFGSAGIALLPLLWILRRFLTWSFRPRLLRQCLHYSLPMIPHTLGSVVFMYSDKLILGFYLPLAQVGLYEVATRIAMVFKQLVVSFDRAVTPLFMTVATESREKAVQVFEPIILKWAAGALFIFLGLSLFAEELLVILAPPEYRAAFVLVPILAGAFVLRGLYQFAVKPILFEKKTSVIPLITVSAGLLNVTGNILLIPVFGVMAAALTTLLSFCVTFGLALLFSRRLFSQRFAWKQLASLVLLAVGVLIVGLLSQTPSFWWNGAIKFVLMAVFSGLLLKLNYGGLRDDIGELWKASTEALFRRKDADAAS